MIAPWLFYSQAAAYASLQRDTGRVAGHGPPASSRASGGTNKSSREISLIYQKYAT